MRLRTFHAADMVSAMTEIRQVLGEQAIIVSTQRRSNSAIEVIAAVESASAPPPASLFAVDGGETGEPAAVESINLATDAGQPNSEFAAAITSALRFHCVPVKQIKQFVHAASAFSATMPSEALARALSSVLRFMPLPDRPQRSFMLVGPPGAGKTVATAKLAARAAIASSPLRIISTDTLKAGSTAQLEAYLRALDQPLGFAASPSDLEKLEKGGRRNRPSVIDTPGTNPFDDGDMENLIRLVAATDVEPVLVMAAGLCAPDAVDIARIFSRLGVRRMIITRLDVTRRLGSILAAAEGAGIAIAEISASPYVAQGLRPTDSNEIARLLMQDHDRVESEHLEEAAQ